jgi:hypothetical protein
MDVFRVASCLPSWATEGETVSFGEPSAVGGATVLMMPATKGQHMTTQDQVNACTTLDELLVVLQKMTDSREVDMTSLPTFGGREPSDTAGVWSWDETRLIVGTGSDYEIVDR